MCKHVTPLLVIAVAAQAASPALALPPPLAEALAPTAGMDPVTYDLTVQTAHRRITVAVDPTAPAGRDLELRSLEPDGSRDNALATLRSEFTAETGGDIWCASLAKQVPNAVEPVSQTPTRAAYRFKPRTDVAENRAERRLLAASVSTMTVERDDPDSAWRVMSLSMRLERPFKPNLVAKITSMNLHIDCEPATDVDGRSYHAAIRVAVGGRAFFARFNERQEVRVSAVRLREPGRARGDGDAHRAQ